MYDGVILFVGIPVAIAIITAVAIGVKRDSSTPPWPWSSASSPWFCS
jgi:hypothetical protein